MASFKLDLRKYSRVLLPFFFFPHQLWKCLFGTACSSISQSVWFLPPLNWQWQDLPRSNVTHVKFYLSITVKQCHKDCTLLRLTINTKLSEVHISRAYLHFPTCLNLLKRKNIYHSLLRDTAPGIPLDIVFTLCK